MAIRVNVQAKAGLSFEDGITKDNQ